MPTMTPAWRHDRIKVGCAGWSIPSRHAHLFGPGDSALARYATRFPVVEINSSFYRPHQPETYARWAATVPEGFRFCVKLPRNVSHERRLQDTGAALDAFFSQVRELGEKLGRLLLQLPPSLAYDARTASTFLRMLRRRTDVAIVCEPRHPSWFTDDATGMLERHGIGRAAVDPAPVPDAAHPGADRSHSYWRWHGAPRIYYSEYDRDALRALAERVVRERGQGDAPWVIFDNTAQGFAIQNAAQMQDMVAA
ncbi:MAG: DUF72 domain-containing protein [Pigmentiphaga sp.]|uniref:DUF72 domain-containing protein n=1 Tax=Pigmentiphaga sp. TaxID=1977564 RepID=UPI003B53644C